MRHPPWYWAPYVLALGALDWLQECLGVTHAEAARAAGQAVRQQGYPLLRRLGVGAALLGLIVLAVAWWGLWLIRAAAESLPPRLLLPFSLLWAVAATVLLLHAALAAVSSRLGRLYARGLKVLERRERTRQDAHSH